MKLTTRAGTIVGLGCLAIAAPAAAQPPRPPAAIEIEAGSTGFADDGIAWEGTLGAAARFYVSPRVSIGPELTTIRGGNHSHLVLTGNVVFDVRRPVNGRPAAVTPYVVVGGGMFRTRETFFDDAFVSSEGAFTVGGGVRALVGDRVTVGGDVRLGWEPHVRVAGHVGVLLGR